MLVVSFVDDVAAALSIVLPLPLLLLGAAAAAARTVFCPRNPARTAISPLPYMHTTTAFIAEPPKTLANGSSKGVPTGLLTVFFTMKVGAAGVSSFILWFSWQTVWHLTFSFSLARPRWPGGDEGLGQDQSSLSAPSLSLQQASACCALLSFCALLVPGMASFGVRHAGIGVVCG